MKIWKSILYCSLIVFLATCKSKKENNSINGLWLVKKVKVGKNEMTPIARWMKFNADSTQTSGNGWLQHSVGTWSLNAQNKLSVTNTNGIVDTAEPFSIELLNNKMTWTRLEDGNKVKVFLERANKIPTSEANKLFGLWKFDSIIENKKEVSDSLNPKNKAMLFLRWDNTYVLYNYPEGEQYGVYKTHGHRLQIDMLSYTKKKKNQYYQFNLENKKLTLKSTNSSREITLTRIHKFLE
ncbi:hypothetical protein [Polaribacter porphyrae]|uniref:Lipocalin-like domain-containing protein n=1 Tax=Polaribacter porphyrae TaxID=1137780 RepID=A0A2S7WKN6_9FLAO|nr:hypothetical protein [Polaribacter porphyrae]PQJ78178.1 hypothetical protein BTO18_02775 [Polaribacter porphyrae]